METVVIVIHLMVVLALVLVVLLQRSEGGALGMGGGGGGGGLMSSRGTANILTRATAVLAVAFFATSLTLSLIAKNQESPASVLDAIPAATNGALATTEGGTESGSGGILDALKPAEPTGPQVPAAQ
ncbi:Preprotein translocase band 1 subunit [Roseibium album]|nr:Preprotein translocase band 1 subunit [Roseibium album]